MHRYINLQENETHIRTLIFSEKQSEKPNHLIIEKNKAFKEDREYDLVKTDGILIQKRYSTQAMEGEEQNRRGKDLKLEDTDKPVPNQKYVIKQNYTELGRLGYIIFIPVLKTQASNLQ